MKYISLGSGEYFHSIDYKDHRKTI